MAGKGITNTFSRLFNKLKKSSPKDEDPDQSSPSTSTPTSPDDHHSIPEVTPVVVDVLDKELQTLDIGSKASNSKLKLSRLPIKTVENLNQILTRHPNPEIVTELILNANDCIKSLPVSIGTLENLKILNLQDNYIQDLPWSIVFLKKLVKLDLSYNMLTVIPKTIGSLKSLEVLNLEANHIRYLPTEMTKLKNLTSLNVMNNKRLLHPPPEVCAKGVAAVFAMMERRSQRNNQWHNFQPWIGLQPQWVPTGHNITSLFDLSVEAVISNKVDFLSVKFLPPLLKNKLNEQAENYLNVITLGKCSVCSRYYTTKERFENHDCRMIGSAH